MIWVDHCCSTELAPSSLSKIAAHARHSIHLAPARKMGGIMQRIFNKPAEYYSRWPM